MKLHERIEAFDLLGKFLYQFVSGEKNDHLTTLNNKYHDLFQDYIDTGQVYNNWFTPGNIISSIQGLQEFLDKDKLQNWISGYGPDESKTGLNIGLIMAGNIPFVGFHDMLCILISGNTCICKMSSKDNRLFKAMLDVLIELNSGFRKRIIIKEDKLSGFDAVIATGSNNSSRYFEYYFGKYPHIIRKNRNSIAVLTGDETDNELALVGDDILKYFGLGCRNVSKLLVPVNYDYSKFYQNIEHYNYLLNHNKYMNNHDYNRSIYLVDRIAHLDNGFLIIKNDETLASPIGVVYAHEYKSFDEVSNIITMNNDMIQCVVGKPGQFQFKTIAPGKSQMPGLSDYADNIDTLGFLTSL